jgi:cell fate (sporulation/competence/biofilm development) regulator YlbF (YheA/YmcA/DUF963 family)
MQDIIRLAQELGNRIAEHSRTKSFVAAAQQVEQDKDASEILHQYEQALGRIQQLEAEGKPIEVADKHAVRELEGKLRSNDTLKNLMKTQADYMELMRQVDTAIQTPSLPQ